MPTEFEKVAGFCGECGSVLPPLRETGGLTCYTCMKTFNPEMLIDQSDHGTSAIHYTIHFNNRSSISSSSSKKDQGESNDEGPIVERKCPKCGNEKMSYATLQLRSADEGQTVFYTCTKCKYKESENS
ncbi:RNA polymerase I subunit RpI12 [Rhynchophorus ferrugineus]|uniref:RNA polymerase I subunit RpI12 n=1 Tax=Rhynchophorus ferrugineus TaxID=354439 RepID=UPI003FCDBC6A